MHGIQRIIANFDDDPETEMAVAVGYDRGIDCGPCGQSLFAILKEQRGEMKGIGGEGKTFGGTISKIKLIHKDKFFELVYTYDPYPPYPISSTEMKIIRWNGRSFSTVWTYEVGRHYARTGFALPHDYSAKVDFVQGKNAQTIRVNGSFAYLGDEEVPWRDYKLSEEFGWRESLDKYVRVREHKRPPSTLLRVYRIAGLRPSSDYPYVEVKRLDARDVDGPISLK